MSGRVNAAIDRLRNPEHTGENRCLPCTIVNAIIAVGASLLVATISVWFAAVLLGLSAIAIGVRGYLVPGTPTLTKRYLPERILRLFGKHPVLERGQTDAETDEEPTFETIEKIERHREHAVDPEDYLEAAGVIAVEDGEPSLTQAFARRSLDQIERYAAGSVAESDLARLFDVDPETVSERDAERPAFKIGARVRNWLSEGALVVDLGTHDALAASTDDWTDVPLEQRLDMLEWLRGYRETCALCGGSVEFRDELLESCCGTWEVTTVSCLDCGERYREFDPSKVGTAEDLKGITA